MNLQTILYGQFTPPLASRVIRHRVMTQKGEKHEPYKPKNKPRDNAYMYAEEVYEIIKAHPGICGAEIAEKLGKSVTRIYRLRDILYDQDRIEGVKGKPQRRGGPLTTLYYVKERPCR